MSKCVDITAITEFKQAERYVCEACEQDGTDWVHLRTCQTCGVTLCCDTSPQKHMTNHFKETGHPVIISAEPGEKWVWCYVHEVFSPYK